MAKVKTTTDGCKIFKCPGCDEYHVLNITEGTRPCWAFNGDHDKPTFTPSIAAWCDWGEGEKEMCHSFVTDGKIEFLSDCSHDKASQTLDIPEWPHAPGEFGGVE